ncbi:23S rRNA (guanosine(2251)-2'-O)-methyltransferase RlmB [Thiohalomonas denitrificans]|uniref:23S rRNA (guanosine(2251)-2'-O)-methyltransferase RlmB n=1 Tax=Thiohalomonas denitrificans TaxID=415747 RepID=UPI0026EE5478|nr:23S rRNA (guanosine(2251)-2'-O)-methyltransferase RlmB [Thiohalomonas denitrificans]
MKEETVFGLHAVQAVIELQSDSITALWLDSRRKDKRLRHLAQLAERAGVGVEWLSKPELDRLTNGGRHQGVVARIRGEAPRDESFLENRLTTMEEPPLLLILDGVTDPHNLGACLRTADAVGAHAVVVPRDRACGLTPTVRKVASGAVGSVPLVSVTNLSRTLASLRSAGVWVVGTALEGASGYLYQAQLTGPLALVLGAEGQGLRRLTAKGCDELVTIPMRGTVQSLNVSVAAGVCLYEAYRQRLVAGC